MRRGAAGLVVVVLAGIGCPVAAASVAPSDQPRVVAALQVATRAAKASAAINQSSLADSLLQTLHKAQDDIAAGNTTDTQAQLDKYRSTVAAQRGLHIFPAAADRLTALVDGADAPETAVRTGAAATVTRAVDGGTVTVDVPSGTKIGIVGIESPSVPAQVAAPPARLSLGGVVVRAYDKYGVPITVPSSPLKLSVTVAGRPATSDTLRSELDTVDPKTLKTQRLASTVAAHDNGTVTVSASTPHLSPFSVTAPSLSGEITNFAGGPGQGQATDVGQYEHGLAVSGTTLYSADFNDGVIRAMDTRTGRETVVAGTTGTGQDPAYGDGGPATDALLNRPEGVAVDAAGDLYIADTGNHKLRRVGATTGIIDTVPGTEGMFQDPTGVAVAPSGDVYITDSGLGGVYVYRGGALRNIPGFAGKPTGIAAGRDGNVYVAASTGDGTWIYRIAPDDSVTPLLRTFTGFEWYAALATDGVGHLLVTSAYQNTVVRIDLTTLAVSPFAGTGASGFSGDGHLATTAQLSTPQGLAVDGDGATYIADNGNVRIRRVDYAGVITTAAGDGTADAGGDGGAATDAQLSNPQGVTADSAGNVFIVDYWNNSVRKVDPTGTITTFVSKLGYVHRLTTDAAGNLYVSESFDTLPSRIIKVKPDRSVSTYATGIADPWGMTFDAAGNLWVADNDGAVDRVAPNGTVTTVLSYPDVDQPIDVAFDATGRLLVADWQQHVVRRLEPDGTLSLFAGGGFGTDDGGAATDAALGETFGLAVAADGRVFISDRTNNVVRVVVDGHIYRAVGTGVAGHSGDGGPALDAQISDPMALALDGAGNLYVSDDGSYCIRRVTP